MDNLTDEQLVEKYLQGDKSALEFLIKRYLTPIFNFILGYVKEEAVADDLTQEVFVKVWKKIKKFDNQYKFKNWLYVIAKNTSLDYLKKNQAINFSALNLEDENLFFEDLIKETSASPHTALSLAQDAAVVNAAVDKLPGKYQETIKLHYHSGYKFREIAEILKESIETVKSRNRRALIYLKRLIKR
jgi:RNA polymerase sigma-70 factor (ECF subfamily)